MKMPNFFIAGMPRCGTTAAHNFINKHSDIFLSEGNPDHRNNEVWYFCRPNNYEKGAHWYSQFFQDARGDEKYIGEKTPWYMREKAIQRIRKDLGPDVKFLLCVRDPILRPFSHWVHAHSYDYGNRYRDKNGVFMSFGRCIRDRDINYSYTEGSAYGKAIRNFLKYFNRDNLHIMVNEEVKINPEQEYRKLFDWLGVSGDAVNYEDCIGSVNLSDYKKCGEILEEDVYFLKETFKYDTEEFYGYLGRRVEAWENSV